jgi:hypothetical protein
MKSIPLDRKQTSATHRVIESIEYSALFKSTWSDGLNKRADMDLGTLLFDHHFLEDKTQKA